MADTPLASVSDVQLRIPNDLNASEGIRLQALLEDVSAAIRSEAGQHISRQTSTVQLAAECGRIWLPEHPVVSITSITNHSSQAVDHTWYAGWPFAAVAGGLVNSWEIDPFSFSTPPIPMTVVYVHGYDPVPDDIVGVCCNVAARALGFTPSDGAVTSESLGQYSVTYGSAAAAGGFGLLPAELAIVRRYRRPRRPISMLT